MRNLTLMPALVATVLCAADRPLPSPIEVWREVHTPHFTVMSALSDAHTEDMVKDLERFHATLVKVLGQRHPQGYDLMAPTEVLLFSSASQLHEYTASSRIGGLCYDSERGPVFLINAGHPRARAVAYHEYLHAYLKATLPGFTLPHWVNEGLAGFFEATSIEDGVVRVGPPLDSRFPHIQKGRRLSVSEMLRSSFEGNWPSKGDFIPRFYATAWFTVHYLQVAAPHRKGQLDAYLWNLKNGFKPDESFVNAFGPPEDLDKELEAYRAHTRIGMPGLIYKAVDLQAPATPPPTVLPRAAALASLGGCLMEVLPAETAWIEAHLDQAFALAPTHPQINYWKAQWAFQQGRVQEAQALLQASVATDGSALNAFRVGTALLNRGKEAERSASAAPYLIQAARQGIGNATCMNRLATSYPGLSADLGTALFELAVAHPAWHGFRKILTQSCLQMGHVDRARALAIADAKSSVPEVAQEAEQVLVSLADRVRQGPQT